MERYHGSTGAQPLRLAGSAECSELLVGVVNPGLLVMIAIGFLADIWMSITTII